MGYSESIMLNDEITELENMGEEAYWDGITRPPSNFTPVQRYWWQQGYDKAHNYDFVVLKGVAE